MSQVLQQGHADGLCGLYALANLLNRDKEWDHGPSDTLWYLLEGCRHFGWLNPYTLTLGFEDFQLKAVLDLQIERYRMRYRTIFLREAKRSTGIKTVNEFLHHVIDAGGSAIVSATRRDHWLLIAGARGAAAIYDSASIDEPLRPLPTTGRSFSPDWGIIILPHTPSPLDLDI